MSNLSTNGMMGNGMMKGKFGLSILLVGLILPGGLAFAQSAPVPAPTATVAPEVIQSIFQLGATTHQQVAVRIGEMQGKIDSLTKELAEVRKNCPASPEPAK